MASTKEPSTCPSGNGPLRLMRRCSTALTSGVGERNLASLGIPRCRSLSRLRCLSVLTDQCLLRDVQRTFAEMRSSLHRMYIRASVVEAAQEPADLVFEEGAVSNGNTSFLDRVSNVLETTFVSLTWPIGIVFSYGQTFQMPPVPEYSWSSATYADRDGVRLYRTSALAHHFQQ